MNLREQYDRYSSHPLTAIAASLGSIGMGLQANNKVTEALALDQPTPSDILQPVGYGAGAIVLLAIGMAVANRALRKHDI